MSAPAEDAEQTRDTEEKVRWSIDSGLVGVKGKAKGKARANLGDTMRVRIGVADLGGRILKWPKTDEKL